EKIYRLQAGDCCFLPPQTWHCDMYNQDTPAYESLWFVCIKNHVGINHFSYEPVGRWDVVTYGLTPEPGELPAMLATLQQELRQDASFTGILRQGLLLQLAGSMARSLEAHANAPGDSVSQRVLAYLEEHYATEI